MSKTNRESRKGKLEAFFRSKTGKILPVLLIALLIGAASSTVYVYFIVSATGTARTPDVRLVAGTDASGSCATYPCATVAVASTNDFATVGFSLFPSATNTPQPATYYSNLTTVQNKGTAAHSIKSIKISGFTGLANLGSITVYYCTAQTEFNPDGTLVTPGNCVGSYSIVSGSSGYQSISGTFPVALNAGSPSKGYIEMAAYALGTASAGSTVSFQISIQWL
jgi:hypothetical protein